MAADAADARLVLGFDAGGTRTRWALTATDGAPVAEGSVAGFSAAQALDPAAASRLRQTLIELAADVRRIGPPVRVHGGVTGYGGEPEPLAAWLADAFALPRDAVSLASDLDVAYRDAFEPGTGVLLLAGTGSIAGYLDAEGTLQRAGGHGVLIDDAGSGTWIAREALRLIWRAEDERPGASEGSPLAHAVFAAVGGRDWADTRRFVYGGDRGQLGSLARAVAEAADADPAALALLHAAGTELARLANVLLARVGPMRGEALRAAARPVALAGRVFALHPAVEAACRAALPPQTAVRRIECQGHRAAARVAARVAAHSAASGAAPAAVAAFTSKESTR